MPRDFHGLPRDESSRLQRAGSQRSDEHVESLILTHFPSESNSRLLSGAKMGHCRVCRDLTVLPGFADGCCLGCMSSEGHESASNIATARIVFNESDFDPQETEINELFREAQYLVPASKLVAACLSKDGFSVGHCGIWLPDNQGQSRRRKWSCPTPMALMLNGLSIRKANARYANDIYAERQRAGLCGSCNSEPLPGLKKCAKHTTKRERYLNWKILGRCRSCGREPESGKVRCSLCLRKRTKDQQAIAAFRKANGICIPCGRQAAEPGTVRCRDCKKKRRERAHQAKAPERI